METEPASEMSFLKFLTNYRRWTRFKNRRLLRWVVRHCQRPV